MAEFVLYIVPGPWWEQPDAPPDRSDAGILRELLRDAVVLRRRIAKGVNAEAERARYSVCAGEIEERLADAAATGGDATLHSAQSAAREGRITRLSVPAGYLDLLAFAHFERAESRSRLDPAATRPAGVDLGESLFPPAAMAPHAAELLRFADHPLLADKPDLRRFAQDRAALVRVLAGLGAGLVEAVEELDNRPPSEPPPRSIPARAPANPGKDARPEADAESTPRGGRSFRVMAARLTRAIAAGLTSGSAVNMSDQPHEVGAEVLAAHLFARPGAPSGQIRVVYADGSEARPFPVRALPAPPRPTPPAAADDGAVQTSLALMSMRHLELDAVVERAWFRNKEVSQTRPLADSDDYCYLCSLRQLDELRSAHLGRTVLIRMHHTGFEPAAIGFYRAVAAELQRRRGWLRVLPFYYRGGSAFEPGAAVWE